MPIEYRWHGDDVMMITTTTMMMMAMIVLYRDNITEKCNMHYVV